MLDNIEVLYHSSIRIYKEKIIYIDPFKINTNYNDADIIFITHDHYDHYSEADINKVKNINTKIVVPKDLFEKVLKNGFSKENVTIVIPNEQYIVDGINFETVPAYNINKKFHPKENEWVGYNIELEGNRYYISGDTDINEDNIKVKCDVAFVPVGGTYTMNFKEAANFINEINPKISVPIHYGDIVGTKEDAEKFIKLLNPEIEGKILMR